MTTSSPQSEPHDLAAGKESLETELDRERNPIKRFLKLLGPGLITGASDDDPSGIGTYSMAGASLGATGTYLAHTPQSWSSLLLETHRNGLAR